MSPGGPRWSADAPTPAGASRAAPVEMGGHRRSAPTRAPSRSPDRSRGGRLVSPTARGGDCGRASDHRAPRPAPASAAGHSRPPARGHARRSTLSAPRRPAQQQRQQFADVEPIGLRPPRFALHFNARRIHHDIAHALLHQPAMQPEAIATGFITTLDRRVTWQAEPRFRTQHLLLERAQIPRSDHPYARPLRRRVGEPQRPFVLPNSNARYNVVASGLHSVVRVVAVIELLLLMCQPARVSELTAAARFYSPAPRQHSAGGSQRSVPVPRSKSLGDCN